MSGNEGRSTPTLEQEQESSIKRHTRYTVLIKPSNFQPGAHGLSSRHLRPTSRSTANRVVRLRPSPLDPGEQQRSRPSVGLAVLFSSSRPSCPIGHVKCVGQGLASSGASFSSGTLSDYLESDALTP